MTSPAMDMCGLMMLLPSWLPSDPVARVRGKISMKTRSWM